MKETGEVAKYYKRKQVESATPGQLVILLYDAAIDNLNRAEGALAEEGPERIEKFHNALIACQNIITELTVSLDMDEGGEIAQNLFRLYDFMNYRLIDANIKKDFSPIGEVRDLLMNLREAWVEVIKQEKPSGPVKKHMGLNLQG